MEVDSFLASPRWEILNMITDNPSSPMEISEQIGTTMSFISQQLKLLEAAGLVKKEKTGAVDKGKPRSIFSVSQESVYLIPLAKNFSEKKLVALSPEKKIVLKIWETSNSKFHPILENFFWTKLQSKLDKIKSIHIKVIGNKCKLFVITDDKSLTHLINEAKLNRDDELVFQVTASSSLPRSEEDNLVPIYVSDILETEDLKGGLQ